MAGVVVGLDYCAVRATAKMIGMKMNRETLSAIQVMEAEVLEIWNAKHKG